MAGKIWFGIPGKQMQWVPAPRAGAQMSNVRFSEEMQFYAGGKDVARSAAYHKEYPFNFVGPLGGLEGVGVFNKFASGFFGTGLIYFADPFIFKTNMLPAHWASPGLIELGWPSICATQPTFADSAASAYAQPDRAAVFDLADVSVAPAMPYRCIVPIPPTHTLHLGASGAATGTGVVRVRPINADGTYAATTDLTLLDPTAATRMNASFAGSSYQAVEIYLMRSGAAPATLTLTSLIAQLWKPSESPVLTGSHVHGEGHTGLEFADDAIVEDYVFIRPPRKAMSTRLVEVGAWRGL